MLPAVYSSNHGKILYIYEVMSRVLPHKPIRKPDIFYKSFYQTSHASCTYEGTFRAKYPLYP